MNAIPINASAEIRRETISEDQCCVIVDDFLQDPHRLVEFAADHAGKSLAFLQQHFPTFREPACYMTGSNEIAELLCTIPARFNRLVFYSGDQPHGATITAPELLSEDVRKGRLTLNVFADVVPK